MATKTATKADKSSAETVTVDKAVFEKMSERLDALETKSAEASTYTPEEAAEQAKKNQLGDTPRTKKEFEVFIEKYKNQNPKRYERVKDRLAKKLASFDK